MELHLSISPISTDYQTNSSNVPLANADTQCYFHEDTWSCYPGHLFVYNYLVNVNGRVVHMPSMNKAYREREGIVPLVLNLSLTPRPL